MLARRFIILALLSFLCFRNTIDSHAATPDAQPVAKVDGQTDGGIGSGSLRFGNGSAVLSGGLKQMLDKLAGDMQAHPESGGVIIWGGTGGNKLQQQVTWARMDQMIKYMSEVHKISRSSFIVSADPAGEDELNFREARAEEAGPSLGPPPAPNLKVPISE